VTPAAIDHIIQATCDVLGVSLKDLGGNSRHERVVAARMVIALLAREMTVLSFPSIARCIGKEAHSTCINARNRLERLLRDDAEILEGTKAADLIKSVRAKISAHREASAA